MYASANDPGAWTDAMEELLTDERLRQRLIEAGTRRVAMFDWERAARETLEVYRLAAADAG
jgi:MMP alpha-(1->4)-mannosyltransferase